ncbi:TPA: NAD(P)-dependent oxidoreductase [Vibrio cholerae]|uniref:NAD-dependent epimerase/dehydratase family protein n=1 Tax=Vibrio cholerae TaxID=666 RepID=UPI0002C1665B|nr:NAD(P)-dependent oxidoreductase [Vibrio cholerae]EIF5161057.1 NAD(P)-dependent oxidoreductase [Vibrio cholerae]EMQ57027.1 polysaccharide biosynthesis family protein [Vibrio cholerae O1 str. EM-1676A]BCN20102.1 CDP-abequose synthase [Vibrio cholerae]GHZ39780.1 nucleotide sugar epimerase [Vibrio cholerae]HAS4283969.1 NAD(P)-dependent oxidoreductase [Vibrio cholerae]
MRVLITGASGFIGKHFIKQNKGKYILTALVRSNSVLDDNGIVKHEYDGTIESIERALEKIDIVLHLATYYAAEHHSSDVKSLISTNIDFGVNLLEAMKNKNVKRIVNIGTTWQKFNGDDFCYANLYAATKQAYQEILNFYVDAYEFKAIHLHLNDTYGCDDKRSKIIQLMIEAAFSGVHLDMSKGDQLFCPSHVNDTIKAINICLELVEKQEKGYKIYSIISMEKSLTIRNLASIIERKTKKELKIRWGARPYRAREIMCPPFDAYAVVPDWIPDVDLESGIRELIRQYENSQTKSKKNNETK